MTAGEHITRRASLILPHGEYGGLFKRYLHAIYI
jgi:hypothetical protein